MKRMISAVLASVMLTGTAAGAIEIQEDWVNLSAWAYNDVSNFTNEGLLPESFKGINDYRVPITREQFAELVYSVYSGLGKFTSVDKWVYSKFFDDSDNLIINMLYDINIVKGVDEEKWYDAETGNAFGMHFMPDNPITREDAAVIIERACSRSYVSYPLPEYILNKFEDDSEIQDYAKNAVYRLSSAKIINGTGNNCFSPQSSMSIEQAIVMLMRIYNDLPTAAEADGAGIKADTETLLKTFDNGFTETKLRDTLYIKNGENTLMEFETDIYSTVFCAENSGRDYILARNFKKRTEVYDAKTAKLLFIIPLPVKKTANGYIYTVSSAADTCFYGLYDFAGNKVLNTEYSEYEVNRLIENNFEPLPENIQNMYYTVSNSFDWLEGGVYSLIGGKSKKLSDIASECVALIDGRLYFVSTKPKNLYSMNIDGSDLVQISYENSYMFPHTEPDGKTYVYFSEYDFSEPYDKDGQLLHTPNGQPGGSTYLFRARFENGELTKEKVFDTPVGFVKLCDYDNNIYFLDYHAYPGIDGPSALYRFDGENTVCLCEDSDGFAFFPHGVQISNEHKYMFLKYGEDTPVTLDFDAKFPIGGGDIKQEIYIAGRALLLMEGYSDNSFALYRNIAEETAVVSADGEMTKLGNIITIKRFNDILYYRDNSALYRYDMNTGEKTLISKNVDCCWNEYYSNLPEDIIVYRDYNRNIYMLYAESGNSVHIYPDSISDNEDDYSKIRNIIFGQNFSFYFNSGRVEYCMEDGEQTDLILPH